MTNPYGIAITPDGNKAWVADQRRQSVADQQFENSARLGNSCFGNDDLSQHRHYAGRQYGLGGGL